MGIRHEIKKLSPPWLQDGRAERYMYVIGLACDRVIERGVQAVTMRLPAVSLEPWKTKKMRADASALPEIGRDRLMRRGPTEEEEHYRERLRTALGEWQLAGSPWRILRQMRNAVLDLAPAMRTVSNRYDQSYPAGVLQTTWNSYAADADVEVQPTREVVDDPGNFDWDSAHAIHGSWSWARMWAIMYAVTPHAFAEREAFAIGADEPKIGDLNWSIGFDTPGNTFDRILDAIRDWRPGNVQLTALLVSFDPDLFDPAEASTPDGTWGRWTLNDTATPALARDFEDVRFCGRLE